MGTSAFRLWIEFGIRGLLVADGDGGVPVGVKKVMPWIFPIQAGGVATGGVKHGDFVTFGEAFVKPFLGDLGAFI